MKKIIKTISICSLFLFLLSPSLVCAIDDYRAGDDYTQAFQESAGWGDFTLVDMIKTIISAFLGLLGIIFLIIIIIAGYKWFTAGGNEAKVKEAGQSISRAIIGLIIILGAYAITYFVFKSLSPNDPIPTPGTTPTGLIPT